MQMPERPKDTLITIRVARAERDELNRAAQERGMSVARLVRTALARDGVPLPNQQARNTPRPT
jgi:uncharacterized protein (DUF1778 family)